ncbi:MAG: hypothetical protein JSU87_10380 [Gemmatimonadota bacterium]|nr:MAG: hypothetical protein JSU87_10380 [Gemmatimonadota bacterium]
MKDATLGGYLKEHGRPPAFEGSDGHSYTVEVICERSESGWSAYLFFVRWQGSEPVGHVESDYLCEAATEEEAGLKIKRLTLHEVRRLLDGMVA